MPYRYSATINKPPDILGLYIDDNGQIMSLNAWVRAGVVTSTRLASQFSESIDAQNVKNFSACVGNMIQETRSTYFYCVDIEN